jgi:putative endonuclease
MFLVSEKNGTFYIGVTNNLETRTQKPKKRNISNFTKKYHITILVYYESFRYVKNPSRREKHLKYWRRKWKINLIEEHNPLGEEGSLNG